MKRIVICMGSSCYARGNARLVDAAESWLASHPAAAGRVDVRGGLCCDRCASGPTVLVDGEPRPVPDAAALRALLEEAASAPDQMPSSDRNGTMASK